MFLIVFGIWNHPNLLPIVEILISKSPSYVGRDEGKIRLSYINAHAPVPYPFLAFSPDGMNTLLNASNWPFKLPYPSSANKSVFWVPGILTKTGLFPARFTFNFFPIQRQRYAFDI